MPLSNRESGTEKVTTAAAAVGVTTLSSAKTSLAADPLALLAKQLGGSKRNALLRWCQNRTAAYTVASSLIVVPTFLYSVKINNH